MQWSSMQLGRVEESFDIADEYIQKNPQNELSQELLLRRGDFYFGQANYLKAIEGYKNFLQKYPNSSLAPKANYWIGLSQYHLKNNPEAILTLQSLVSKYSDNNLIPDALFQLGVIYREENQFDKSREMFGNILGSRLAVKRDREFLSDVYLQLGLTYRKMEIRTEAEQAFKEAISSSPNSFSSYQAQINLSRLYSTTGKTDEGIELLNNVIHDRSDELAAEAQKVLGDIYFEMGDYDNAVTNYLRVKYIYSGYRFWVANALYHAGMSYEKMNRFEDARKVYEELIRDFPTEEITQKAKERLTSL